MKNDEPSGDGHTQTEKKSVDSGATPAAVLTETAGGPASPATRAAGRPARFLLLMDAENAIKAFEERRIPFDPMAIRDRARAMGEIVFAYAYANFTAIAPHDRQQLHVAGFEIVHCERFSSGNGGASKDTVDNALKDSIVRHRANAFIDGVILVSNDSDFTVDANNACDCGFRFIVFTTRPTTVFASVTEVVYLLDEDQAVSTGEPSRWNPEEILRDLEQLPRIPDIEHVILIAKMQIRAPCVVSVLRELIARSLTSRQYGFKALVSQALLLITRRFPNKGDMDAHAFVSGIISAKLFEPEMRNLPGIGGRRVYPPNRGHPFVADVQRRVNDAERQRLDGATLGTPPPTIVVGAVGGEGAATTFCVGNLQNDEVLGVEAETPDEAVDFARARYGKRRNEFAEVDLAILLGSLHVTQAPPTGSTPQWPDAE
ncbi:MAG: NYN domain-containing protein [Candidatus Uhrbacteria bacterium]